MSFFIMIRMRFVGGLRVFIVLCKKLVDVNLGIFCINLMIVPISHGR